MFRNWSTPRRKYPPRGGPRTRIERRRAGACFERLEPRQMLSATAWQGASGDWNDPTHWTSGVPTTSSDVTIAISGATVTIPAGEADTVHSLTLGSNAALAMPAGSDPTNPTTNWNVNSDFESPVKTNSTTSPATWWPWGAAYLSGQYAYSGSQSLVVSGNNSGVAQPFTPTPGNSYTASVYAMTPASDRLSGDAAGYLQVLFFDASGAEINVANDSLTVLTASGATGGPLAGSVGNQGWNHFYTTVVAPSGAVTAQVQFEFYSTGGAGGAVYCDDLDFGPAAGGPSQLVAGSIVNSGTLTVGPADTVTVSGALTQYSTGALDLELGSGGPSQLVAGSIVNSGTLTVGPADTVTVGGALTQTSTGTLDVQLGGGPSTKSFGAVDAGGIATLAGTLKADIVNGYAPATTDSFTPIEFAGETGNFTSLALPSGAGYQFNAAVTFTNVMLAPPRPRRSVPPSMRRRTCTPSRPICWASTWSIGTRTPGALRRSKC